MPRYNKSWIHGGDCVWYSDSGSTYYPGVVQVPDGWIVWPRGVLYRPEELPDVARGSAVYPTQEAAMAACVLIYG